MRQTPLEQRSDVTDGRPDMTEVMLAQVLPLPAIMAAPWTKTP